MSERPVGRPMNVSLDKKFLDATIELISAQGYRAVSTAAVAKRAGASTASLYRRWPTKRELVLAAARAFAEQEQEPIDSGSLIGDLTAEIRYKQDLMTRVGPVLLGLLAEAQHDSELLGVLDQALFQPTRDCLRDILDRAIDRGEISSTSAPHAEMLTDLILGSTMLSSTQGPSGGSPIAPETLATTLAASLLPSV
ncbi:TetR/AcrR family transcriptional regulator [Kocuria sp.]|uniref:TetR/AcrR family transcriptional regulator n=1 Tax=Kocuria sp. TaxID=1871328 RepID=UPI0026DF0C76|nr:TetR/AcrR family transcriptional regulator [Kocuria sp.]MDO5619141.1 TetR/AcrR family transcriptional regulator [Kocuria sp.]